MDGDFSCDSGFGCDGDFISFGSAEYIAPSRFNREIASLLSTLLVNIFLQSRASCSAVACYLY